MASNILAKMAVQISANTAEFNKALAKTNKDISSFTNGIAGAAKAVGVAFGAQQIASFAFDMAKLAGEAEAVSIAFNRLENSKILLRDLKEATHGTVSELELMKRAVQASNFDISLKALPRLLEFATLRAQQTGQSVDYLVDSIVTGIGRKSKLILDNLGISAEQLKQEFKGASLEAQSVGAVADAVGRIAEKNLKNMAGFSQNAATSVQQLAAAWEDLKVSVGNLINKSGLPSFVKEMAELARFFAGDFTLSKEQVKKTEEALGELIKKSKELGNQSDVMKYSKMLAELASQYTLLRDKAVEFTGETDDDTKKLVSSLELLRTKQKDLNEEFESTDINDKKKLKNIGDEIVAIDIQIKKLEELKKAKEPLKLQPIFDDQTIDAADTFFHKFEDGSIQLVTNAQMVTKSLQDEGYAALTTGQALITLGDTSTQVATKSSEEWSKMVEIALAASDIIGNSISSAFSKAFSGVQILARATSEIVDLFARQAIAAAIANAAKAGGPFPFASVILATSAAAAMRGLLSRVGAKTGGGGGGGGFSSPSYPSRPTTNEGFQNFALSTSVSGTDLNIVMGNTNNRNRFTRP